MTHLSPLASPSLGWKDFSADLLNRFKLMLQRTIVVKPVLSRLLKTETRSFARTKETGSILCELDSEPRLREQAQHPQKMLLRTVRHLRRGIGPDIHVMTFEMMYGFERLTREG